MVVEDVMMKPSGAANYAVSRSGTLVYMPAGAVSPTPVTSLVWVDRTGHEEPVKVPMRAYGPPRISPDGTRVALGIPDQQANIEIWILDLGQERLRRLTFSRHGWLARLDERDRSSFELSSRLENGSEENINRDECCRARAHETADALKAF